MAESTGIMVGDKIMVQGADISKENLESLICKHLGLPKPESPKKGILSRLLHK